MTTDNGKTQPPSCDPAAPPASPTPPADLGRRAAHGVLSTFAGQFAKIGLQLAGVVVIARMVPKDQVGFVLAAMAFLGLADVLRDFGLSPAAIAARTLSKGQRTNLWWANTGMGALTWAIIAATAPWSVHLLASPQALAAIGDAVAIIVALGSTFFINGMATQYRASLNRNMRFHTLAVIEVVSGALGLVAAVVLAAAGGGAWAMAWQQIVVALTSGVMLVAVSRWLPGKPGDWAHTRDLLTFGGGMVAVQLLGYVGQNIDRVLVGRFLGLGASGDYGQVNNLLNRPLTQVRAPTTTIALPVLSSLQDDKDGFGAFVIRGQIGLAYTIVPCIALAAAAADPLVNIVLGPRYGHTGPVLMAVCLAGAATTLSYVGYWVFVAKALTSPLLHWTLGTSLVRGVLAVAALPWGVVGVAWAVAVMPVIAAPASLWWLGRLTDLPTAELLYGYARAFGLAVLAAALGYNGAAVTAASGHADIVAAAAGMGVAAATYGAALIVPLYRHDAGQLREFVKVVRSRRG